MIQLKKKIDILDCKENETNYIDIPMINDDKLNNIEITLGPKCNESHKIIVKSILDKYSIKDASIINNIIHIK